ncbi:MAG TPA: ATP-binding protein, partial [Bacteroidia bacterium]|nr:ATP-binding protein [Bacteroidia bacterium]
DEQNKKRRDVAAEIIALSNRYGGKLIIGVNDDGTFDGKSPYTIDGTNVGIDEIKSILHQICYDSISPRLEITTNILSAPKEDVIVVYVPPKKGIPYAVTPNKKAGEINNRIYYIRTSHGKRLVSDEQLAWLFKENSDPSFKHKLRIGIEFSKDYEVIGNAVPLGNHFIWNFIAELGVDKLKELINKDFSNFGNFFSQLMPLFILESVGTVYSNCWNLRVENDFSRTHYMSTTNPPLPSKVIDVKDITITGETILPNLGWEFDKIMEEHIGKFSVPPNTNVSINYPRKYQATMTFKNPDFEMTIHFGIQNCGSGLHMLNPTNEVIKARYSEGDDYLRSNFKHIDGVLYFESKFDFPEYDVDGFNHLYQYANSWKELLDAHWNYERLIQQLPSKEILIIDHKLDEVLAKLNKGSNS